MAFSTKIKGSHHVQVAMFRCISCQDPLLGCGVFPGETRPMVSGDRITTAEEQKKGISAVSKPRGCEKTLGTIRWWVWVAVEVREVGVELGQGLGGCSWSAIAQATSSVEPIHLRGPGSVKLCIFRPLLLSCSGSCATPVCLQYSELGGTTISP